MRIPRLVLLLTLILIGTVVCGAQQSAQRQTQAPTAVPSSAEVQQPYSRVPTLQNRMNVLNDSHQFNLLAAPVVTQDSRPLRLLPFGSRDQRHAGSQPIVVDWRVLALRP